MAPLIAPPDTVPKELMFAPSPSPTPSPAPASDGVVSEGPSTVAAAPRGPTVASSSSIPGYPANGPAGSISIASCLTSYHSLVVFLISFASYSFVILV